MIDSMIMLTTDRSLLKAKVIKAGIEQYHKMITDFRRRIQDIMQSEANDIDEYESHQQSFKSETMVEVSLLSDQLQFADREMEKLRQIHPYYEEQHPIIEYGTVVITDKDNFFISSGIERFYAGEFAVLGLSVHSTLYTAMKGKKVGDYFTCNGLAYHVEEIF
jgi:hypothetical protein